MHRANEIRENNISSYVIPEIQLRLNALHGTSFSFDSMRSKYYAMRELTKLYISFKRRGTRLGWNSQNHTFLVDDDRRKEMEQVNPKYTKFQNDCIVYRLLEEVFAKQAATGEFSAGFENDPHNSSEELEMKNEARGAQGKSRLEIEDRDAEVEIVGSKKEKGKKGKRKRKSRDASSGSPMATASGSITDRYFQALNTIESLVSQKKTSSMSVSISSPTKHASGAS